MAFQCIMDILLCPHQKFTVAYLDDVVIHSSTLANQLHHLKSILRELRKAGITANPQKYYLELTQAQYLGYCISQELLKPQEKIEAVQNYPQPSTKHQVHAFLGLARYNCRSMPNFSSVASPLCDLTRKVRWTSRTEQAFQTLKKALTIIPFSETWTCQDRCFGNRTGCHAATDHRR